MTIQQQYLRLGMLGSVRVDTFQEARLESDLSTGFKRQEGANGIALCYGSDEILDLIVIPDVATLEVGELEDAVMCISQ